MKKIKYLVVFLAFTNFSQAQVIPKDSLISALNIIEYEDQTYRLQLNNLQNIYPNDSLKMRSEMKQLFSKMKVADSINTIKVTAIIDKYGWLGEDVIGYGNTTLFGVIQHSDFTTQEKYLPIMREAVKNGNAKARSLALLEDRVALHEGKKQIYGSQLQWNVISNKYVVMPMEDPDNVDKRRLLMGLGTLAEYLGHLGITWDIEQYKKDLPALEEKYHIK